ncbi:hypothetical protein EDB19DRAFT_2039773 [Suillus lakei]|nr:hypothetical protein EDB19DRAFT_2039773 [Suillus lakei]
MLRSHLPSFWRWRRPNPHSAIEFGPQSQFRPVAWDKDIVSNMLCSRHGSNIELREPPMVEVPWIAGKPRDYYTRAAGQT